MGITVEHDDLGTHFDWSLDGVTPCPRSTGCGARRRSGRGTRTPT
jgi:hypothetical protein